MSKSKKLASITALSLLAAALLLLPKISSNNKINDDYSVAIVGGSELDLELAITQEEQAAGLSGRDLLAENTGMLFIYDKPENIGIWMKGVKFNIDVFWLNEDREIIHIVENMSPDSYISDREAEIFRPQGLARYVLEVNSGFAEENSISLGDSIELK